MPLVDQNQLEQALSDAPTRNKLIKQLRATPSSESFYLRKLVLSMWLGANFRLPRAYRKTLWEEAVSLIYFCLLGFDKTLSTLENGPAKTHIMACQKALFQFYNLHSHYLRDPPELIDAFKTILNHHYCHSNQVEWNDNRIISATLTMCSAELERFGKPNVNYLTPTPAIANYRVSPQSYFERFCHYVVKQHATLGLPPNYFYPESMGDTNHLHL